MGSAPLNNHATGAVGGVGIASSLLALGKLLTDPQYLIALYHALVRHDSEVPIAQLVAAVLGIVVSAVVLYVSKPFTVHTPP